MRTLSLLVVFSVAVHAQPAPDLEPDLEGEWEGLVEMPGATLAMTLTLNHEDGQWGGTVDVPAYTIDGMPVAVTHLDADSLHVELMGGSATLAGRFEESGSAVSGTVRQGTSEGAFVLARPGSPDAVEIALQLAAWEVEPSAHPDSARIVTEDIPRFWAAYDASTPETRVAALQRDYFDPGSPGLDDFLGLKIGSVERMAAVLDRRPRFYASIRSSTLRAHEAEPAVRAAFRRMEALYPDAVYPDVYFLIGGMSAGGTASRRGLLIGTEFFSRTPEMPEDELTDWHRAVLAPVETLPLIVAHELIHYLQDLDMLDRTLLNRALLEGSADYLGRLISEDGRAMNDHIYAWADPQEEAVWCAFEAEMDGSDTADWIANGGRPADRPAGLDYADLGYYVGHQISEAYHEQARAAGQSDAEVVRDILHIDDAKAFLDASGYAERFACDG